MYWLHHIAQTVGVVAVVLAIGGAASLAITGSPARRVFAYLVAMGLIVGAPWMVHGEFVLGRLFVGLSVTMGLLRGLDLVRASTHLPALRRLAHAVSVVDSAQLTRVGPRLDRHALARIAGFAPIALVGGVCARALHAHQGPLPWVARMVSTLVMVYALVEIMFASMRLGYAAAGFTTPTLHDDPVRSRTLQEFWAERWNRVIHQALWRHGFLSLARRGHGRAGIAVAFVVSAVMHVYLSLTLMSPRSALLVGGFFLAQGALVVVERRLMVKRWRPIAARLWTFTVMLATAPLFLQGVLEALGW